MEVLFCMILLCKRGHCQNLKIGVGGLEFGMNEITQWRADGVEKLMDVRISDHCMQCLHIELGIETTKTALGGTSCELEEDPLSLHTIVLSSLMFLIK